MVKLIFLKSIVLCWMFITLGISLTALSLFLLSKVTLNAILVVESTKYPSAGAFLGIAVGIYLFILFLGIASLLYGTYGFISELKLRKINNDIEKGISGE